MRVQLYLRDGTRGHRVAHCEQPVHSDRRRALSSRLSYCRSLVWSGPPGVRGTARRPADAKSGRERTRRRGRCWESGGGPLACCKRGRNCRPFDIIAGCDRPTVRYRVTPRHLRPNRHRNLQFEISSTMNHLYIKQTSEFNFIRNNIFSPGTFF